LTVLSLQGAIAEEKNYDFSFKSIEGISPHDRVEIIPNGYTNRIGRLTSSEGGFSCTATLIADNLIITADHCTENDDMTTRLSTDFTFYAGFSHNLFAAESKVTKIITSDHTSANAGILSKGLIEYSFDDIAIMVLEKPLGLEFGYETIRLSPLPALPNNTYYDAVQIGYNRNYGRVMTGDIDCGIAQHFLNPAVLSSFCLVGPMDSGSPQFIWIENEQSGKIERQIIGITSREVATGSMVTPIYQSKIIRDLNLSHP
jgi:V8-like Glu-specific endopeptidase